MATKAKYKPATQTLKNSNRRSTAGSSAPAAGALAEPIVESIVAPEGPEEQLRTTVFEIFRRWGYLQASLDPLKQYLPAEPFPVDLPEGSDAVAAEARAFYCGSIALEFSHIASPERRDWLQAAMERTTRRHPRSRRTR